MPSSHTERIRMARAKTWEDLPDITTGELPLEDLDEMYAAKVQVIPVGSPDTDWYLAHGLGGRPSVEITDSSGGRCYGSVTYLSNSLIHVHFSSPFSGEARLRQ